jgi:predicted phage-related endonuclease
MLANVDRIIIDKTNGNGVLEVKTTSVYNKDAWTDGKIPDEYMLQIQHYLAVTGLSYAYVAVLIGGQKYHHQHIPRDNELIAYLIQIESDFWKLVENKTPPEMDGSDSSSDVLNYLYPQANPDSKIDLPPTAELLVGEYEWASSEEKQWAIRKEEAANKLKAMLGEYEVGMAGSKKINWKNVISNRLDSKSLKADMPDIYQKYSKESYTRRFTIAAIKG